MIEFFKKRLIFFFCMMGGKKNCTKLYIKSYLGNDFHCAYVYRQLMAAWPVTIIQSFSRVPAEHLRSSSTRCCFFLVYRFSSYMNTEIWSENITMIQSSCFFKYFTAHTAKDDLNPSFPNLGYLFFLQNWVKN